MKLFTRDRSFYISFFAICIPVIVQNILNVALNMSDNLMLSFLGEIEISAASQANQVYFIFTLFTFGLSSGASVLMCQYWGRDNHEAINKIAGIALALSFAVSVLFFLAAFFCGEQIMNFYAKDSEVIRLGVDYLKICSWSYMLSAITSVAVCFLRATEQAVYPTVVSLISLVMNISLNYCFIFGKFGFPDMGVAGAAAATLISRAAEALIIVFIVFFVNKKIKIRLSSMFRISKQLIRDFAKYSLPVVANETLWGLGISMHAAIIGNLGADCNAAYNIANIIERLAMVACMGMGCTGGIIVGKELGRGEKDKAYLYAKTLIFLNAAVGIVTSVLLITVRPYILSFFNLKPEVIAMAYDIIGVMSFILVLKAVNTTMIVGILRSGGATKLALALDVPMMWVFCIPLGYLTAHVWSLPLHIVYFVLMSDELVKCVLAGIAVKRRSWIKNVTV